jgi:hypothetical protein
MEPTRQSVLKAMAEFRSIGNEEFLGKYTNGRPPIYMYLRHDGAMYPLKALWAAAHRPAVAASSFNSWQARSRLKHLNFTDAVSLEGDETEIIVLDELHRVSGEAIPFAMDVRESIVHEGARVAREVKTIKRNAAIVAEAKRLKGCVCEACDFDFGAVYGTIGEGFIEAHHIEPLSERNGVDKQTTVDDFAMLCSNCHAMVHKEEPAMPISKLRKLLKKMQQIPAKKSGQRYRAH